MSTHPPLQNGLLDGKPAGEASAGTRAAGSPRRGARGGPPSKVTEDEGAAADRRRQGGPRSRPGGSLGPELSWKGLSQAPFAEGAEKPEGCSERGGDSGGGAAMEAGLRAGRGLGGGRGGARKGRGRLGAAWVPPSPAAQDAGSGVHHVTGFRVQPET